MGKYVLLKWSGFDKQDVGGGGDDDNEAFLPISFIVQLASYLPATSQHTLNPLSASDISFRVI